MDNIMDNTVDNTMDNTIEDEKAKKISICGTNNRYQMKKVTKQKNEIKKRVESEKWKFSEEYLEYGKQLNLLNNILQNKQSDIENDDKVDDNTSINSILKIITQQINKKISSYKQQDILKKVFNNQEFISFNFIIQKLIDCNLKCFYCNCNMFILYEMVRENKQWTVDRINNDLGHNNNNIVIACLECNLKRRNKTKDSFLFTKQLKITREGIDENDI